MGIVLHEQKSEPDWFGFFKEMTLENNNGDLPAKEQSPKELTE
jgi:hypothetical protein